MKAEKLNPVDEPTAVKVVRIVQIAKDKKANNIKVLHIDQLTSIAEYFIILNGESMRHIQAISRDIHMTLKGEGISALAVEGESSEWILIDYGDVIVHLFTSTLREYYNLDGLWGDAEVVAFE